MDLRYKIFADSVISGLSLAQSYRNAYPGVTDESARSSASRLMREHPEIQEYINEEMEKIHDEKIADAKEVMKYLTSVMRGESQSSVLALCGDGKQKILLKPPDEKDRLKAAELIKPKKTT